MAGVCNEICLFAACRQIPAEHARRRPQIEMPNRAWFLELHAAYLARFGDSGMIEAARVINTGSMAIDGQNSAATSESCRIHRAENGRMSDEICRRVAAVKEAEEPIRNGIMGRA